MPELIVGRGAGNSRPGGQGVVQRQGLPELIAELAWSGADPRGSAGGVEKTPWSIFRKSSKDCAPGSKEAAMAPNGTAQSTTGQRAGAAVGEQEVAVRVWVMEAQALATTALKQQEKANSTVLQRSRVHITGL
jgi:hypothetical protein